MSQVKVVLQPEAKARHWTSVSAAMFEGIANVLSGKKFGSAVGAVAAAIKLFDLALKGYPLIIPYRSDVYQMVKDIMFSTFGFRSDEKILVNIVIWRSLLDININKNDPLSYRLDDPIKEHLERMKSFFNALCHKGEQEYSDRFGLASADDDE